MSSNQKVTCNAFRETVLDCGQKELPGEWRSHGETCKACAEFLRVHDCLAVRGEYVRRKMDMGTAAVAATRSRVASTLKARRRQTRLAKVAVQSVASAAAVAVVGVAFLVMPERAPVRVQATGNGEDRSTATAPEYALVHIRDRVDALQDKLDRDLLDLYRGVTFRARAEEIHGVDQRTRTLRRRIEMLAGWAAAPAGREAPGRTGYPDSIQNPTEKRRNQQGENKDENEPEQNPQSHHLDRRSGSRRVRVVSRSLG